MRGPDGTLTIAASDRLIGPVRALRAAPFSDPDRYICIVDANGEEVTMIRDLAEVDAETRQLLREELHRSYATLTIQRINSARAEGEVSYLSVETECGSQDVVVQDVHERIRQFERRLVICDAEGRRFEIPDLGRLERRSAKLLERIRRE
jgi:hypothetical protein